MSFYFFSFFCLQLWFLYLSSLWGYPLLSDPNNANCYLCKWNEIACFRALADECVLGLPWFQIFWITYSITRISGPSLKVELHTFILLNEKNCSDLYLKAQVIFCVTLTLVKLMHPRGEYTLCCNSRWL